MLAIKFLAPYSCNFISTWYVHMYVRTMSRDAIFVVTFDPHSNCLQSGVLKRRRRRGGRRRSLLLQQLPTPSASLHMTTMPGASLMWYRVCWVFSLYFPSDWVKYVISVLLGLLLQEPLLMFGDKSGLIQSFGVAAMSGICTYVPVYNSVYLFSVRLTILAT